MTAPAYLDLAAFRVRSIMPSVDIDAVETDTSGFTDQRLATNTSRINSRLRKRYAVPFADPIPEIVLEWLTKITTYECYLKRGVDPSDQTLALVRADRDQAEADLKEAADSKDGLFDLPVNDDGDPSAVNKGGPLGYSEQSPWTWTDLQEEQGGNEDGRR